MALLLANASPVAVIVVAVGALALAGVLAYLRRPAGVADVERVRGQLEEQLAAADASIAHLGPALDLGGEPTAADVDRLLATLDDERRVLEGEEARRDRAIAATQEVERLTDEVATIAQGVGLPAAPGPPDLEAFGEAIEADRARANRLTGLQEQASGLRATLATVETRRDELVTAVGEREAEAAAARTTWQEWLGAHDLDPSYDRETAARVVDAVTAAKATVMAMRTLETRHDAQRAERESFEAQVADLADLLPARRRPRMPTRMGRRSSSGGRLASAIDGERARDALVRTQAERAEALTLAEEARAAATGSLDAFLVELEVGDPDELRAEVDRSDHGRSLSRPGDGPDHDPGGALRAGRGARGLPGGPGRGDRHRRRAGRGGGPGPAARRPGDDTGRAQPGGRRAAQGPRGDGGGCRRHGAAPAPGGHAGPDRGRR